MKYYLVGDTWFTMNEDNSRYVILGNYLFEKYLDINKDILFSKYKSFKNFTYYVESRLAVRGANDKWGFLDRSGNLIVDCKYNEVSAFKKGIAIVFNGKYGVVDYLGNEIIPCLYDNIYYDSIDDKKLWVVSESKNVNKQVDIDILVGDYNYPKGKDIKIIDIGERKMLNSDGMVVWRERNGLVLYDIDNQITTTIRNLNFDGIVNDLMLRDLKDEILVYDIMTKRYFNIKEIVEISDDFVRKLKKNDGMV